MEARAVLKFLMLLFLSYGSSVKSEDIESSGAGEVTDLIPGLFESSSSGGGADSANTADGDVALVLDAGDQELNETFIPVAPNNGNIMNDTLETDLSDTTTRNAETTAHSTTKETTATSTTTMETTVLTDKFDEAVISVATTHLETSPTDPPTTEAPSTTTSSAGRTTTFQTTLRTTKRQPTQKTVKPVLSTTKSPTTSDYTALPCYFDAEELECSTELVCFGDGELDCTLAPGEKEPWASTSSVLHSTGSEYEDDYEDIMTSTEPSYLMSNVPPWKKLSAMRQRYLASTARTTTASYKGLTGNTEIVDDDTSEFLTTVQNESNTDYTTNPAEITTVTSNVPTTSTEKAETETEKAPVELPMPTETSENGSEHTANSEKNITKEFPNSGTHSELPSTESSEIYTEKNTESSSPKNVESVVSTESKSRRRRSKRQNKHPVPDSSVLSSSEPLKLSSFNVNEDRKDPRLCRIKGNLKCTPIPTLGLCKGSGRCVVAAVEKKQKSTGKKGVENWAVAVIAICATAAVITISVLGYMVVTSWKKLKVQPQAGVTTLTYVNNATP